MNKIMVTKELNFTKVERDHITKKPTLIRSWIIDCLIWKPRELHIALRNLIEKE